MIINSNLTNNTNSSQESNLELLNHLINIEDCNNNLNSLLDKNSNQPMFDQKLTSMLINTCRSTSDQASLLKLKKRHEKLEICSDGQSKLDERALGTVRVPTCVSCRLSIEDKYIFNLMNMFWHEECLTCSQCCTLLNQSCFFKNGQLFCKEDYFKNFGTRCNSCADPITPNELVMRIEAPQTFQSKQIFYHLSCFKCLMCEKHLQKGDEYILRQEGIYCKNDFEKNFHSIVNRCSAKTRKIPVNQSTNFADFNNSANTNNCSSFSSSPVSSSSSVSSLSTTSFYSNGSQLNPDSSQLIHTNNQSFSPHLNQIKNFNNTLLGPNQKLNSTNTNSNSSFASIQSEEENSLDIDSAKNSRLIYSQVASNRILNNQAQQQAQVQIPQRKSGNSRRITKRPRTILNAAQRYDFREAFKQSPKPCRKVREHLADKTGLSVRVVQVWFQNERAKMKKMQRRQQQHQQMGKYTRGDGEGGMKDKLDGKGLKRKKRSKLMRKEKKGDDDQEESNDDENSDDEDEDSLGEDETDVDDEDEEEDEEESLDLDENESDINEDDNSNIDIFKKRKFHLNTESLSGISFNGNHNQISTYENGSNLLTDNFKPNLSMNFNMFSQNSALMESHQYQHQSNELAAMLEHQHQHNPIDRLYSMQSSYFCSS